MPTVTDVLDAVADAAHLAAGRSALVSSWPGIAGRALAAGVRDVVGTLAAQGLTGTQIASWAGYESAVLQQATYWALEEGGALLPRPVNQEDVRELDLREWLKTVALTDAAGNLIVPDPGKNLVGHGSIAGGWEAVKAASPRRHLGFLDRHGRLRRW